MNGGVVSAVQYFLNPCYEPTLVGEWKQDDSDVITWNGCTSENYDGVVRGRHEGIAISSPISVSGLSGEFQDLAFEFVGSAIPIDAYDIRLQVVYQGAVGADPEAIVIGSKNISEPTFFGILNSKDYYSIDGVYYLPAQIAADPVLLERIGGADYESEGIHLVTYRVGGELIAGPGSLGPKEFHRIAVLADSDAVVPVTVHGVIDSGGVVQASVALPAANNQFERAPFTFWPVNNVRGALSHWLLGLHKGTGAAASLEAFLALPELVDGCTPVERCAAMPTEIEIVSQ